MSGNICRCGAYPKIELAILRAAEEARVKRIRQGQDGLRGLRVRRHGGLRRRGRPRSFRGGPTPSSRSSATRCRGSTAPSGSSGAARFTVDVQLPRMLHAAVLRSPVANGRVERLDLEAARAAPGVRAVLGPGRRDRQRPVAAERRARVRRRADRRRRRRDARSGAGRARAARRRARRAAVRRRHRGGAARAALHRRADRARARRARIVRVGGGPRRARDARPSSRCSTPLEPHAAVADWQEDELTVWSSTQGIFGVRDELAGRFGLPASQRARDRRVRRRRLRLRRSRRAPRACSRSSSRGARTGPSASC